MQRVFPYCGTNCVRFLAGIFRKRDAAHFHEWVPAGTFPGVVTLFPTFMTVSVNRHRAFAAAALILLGAAGACTDAKSKARGDSLAVELTAATFQRDSLQTAAQSASAEKDRALNQVVEATKFADQVDAELRQVRTLTSKVSVKKSDESGKTEAADAKKDILDRLSQMRKRNLFERPPVAAVRSPLFRRKRGRSPPLKKTLRKKIPAHLIDSSPPPRLNTWGEKKARRRTSAGGRR